MSRACVLVLGVVVLTGCGSVSGEVPSRAEPTSPKTTAPSAVPGGIDPRELISSTKLMPAAKDWGPSPGDQVLQASVAAGLSGPQEAAANWQAAVLAVAANTSGHVIAAGINPPGNVPPGSASFRIRQNPSFTPSSAAVVTASLTEGLPKLGLTPKSVVVSETAAGPSAIVIATIPKDTVVTFLEERRGVVASLADLGASGASIYVQVLDDSGRVLLVDAAVPQTEISFRWIDSAQNFCSVGLPC